jgi:LytS/YehU family sensor histidine kinase
MTITSFSVYYYKQARNLEIEKTKAELNALKTQINPHFFFNALNIIYAQAIIKSDKTPESITQIASMMRYALTEHSENKVALSKELEYIKSYIALQQQRITSKTKVYFNLEGNPSSLTIPPFLFINLIENAFKYGVSNETESKIKIHFNLKENKEFH